MLPNITKLSLNFLVYVIYIFAGFTRHLMNNNYPHFALTLCFLKDNIHIL